MIGMDCAASEFYKDGIYDYTIFEGEKGFMKVVSGSFELPRLGGRPALDGASVPFKILDTYIKHFPVEYHAQTAVEDALALRAKLIEQEGPETIHTLSDVEIGSYAVAIEIIGRDPEKWRPATRETADHSFPYCVAAALMDGRLALPSFNDKRLADPALRKLMRHIRVIPLPEFAVNLALGEMGHTLLLDSRRVVPTRLEKAGFEFRHPELKEALAAVLD